MIILLLAALQAQPRPDTLPGYPIRDSVVIRNCGACHVRDSTGRMTRISYQRKTPEGWETSIRRMMTLNNVRIDTTAARQVLRYLANNQGLAPEELRPARFEVERRMIDYRYTAHTQTENTCRACHSLGRVISQRRTREEWGLVVAMHRGYYPGVDGQNFRRFGPPAPGGDAAHPMDAAISHLSTAFPLSTPDWNAWSATMRPARLEGTWVISGTQPGRGAFYGTMTVARSGAADDEFTTTSRYTFAQSGESVTRTGRATIYTGHQWRGRSTEGRDTWREVMHVEPNWTSITGRWFTGAYDEIGMDVSVRRVGADLALAGVFPRALRRGTSEEVRVYGSNLPANAMVDFGPGVVVERVLSATPQLLTLSVRASADAKIGARDLFVGGQALRSALIVHDTISRIRITPLAGMARIGGIVFPKGLQQFEVVAIHNGPDGRPDTPDDLELGPVPVTWALEEYGVTYDDDDIKFVGALSNSGLFTPAEDGPNPRRSGQRNNIGDVWVTATYKGPASSKPLRARAHLLVTVPLYMRWEPWRIE